MFSKAILTSLVAGALAVNALNTPVAREPVPEPDFQQIDARAFPIPVPAIKAGLTAVTAAAPLVPLFHHHHNPKREVGIDAREFETRDPFNPLSLIGGLLKKLKRDEVELLSRDLQQELNARDPYKPRISLIGGYPHGFRQRAEDGVVSREVQQGLDARDPFSSPSIARTGLSAIEGLIAHSIHKGKREVGNELFLREPLQEIDARDPISPLSLGFKGLSIAGPLIGKLFHHKGKREVGDGLSAREVHEWAKWAEAVHNHHVSKREPSPQYPGHSHAGHHHHHPHPHRVSRP